MSNKGTSSITEPIIWEGSPSWLLAFKKIFFWGLLAVLVPLTIIMLWTNGVEQPRLDTLFWILLSASLLIPFGIVLFSILDIRYTKYKLTSERFIIRTGIFSRTTDEIELYRVKDVRHLEPFLLRIFGLSIIEITSSDKTNSFFSLKGIKDGGVLRNNIRHQVERIRRARGVREIDFD